MTILKKAKKELKEGNLEEAIEILKNDTDSSNQNELVFILVRYKELKKQILKGIIADEKRSLDLNRIVNDLLQLIDNRINEAESKNQMQHRKNAPPKNQPLREIEKNKPENSPLVSNIVQKVTSNFKSYSSNQESLPDKSVNYKKLFAWEIILLFLAILGYYISITDKKLTELEMPSLIVGVSVIISIVVKLIKLSSKKNS